MLILGIETSCDETSAAVVRDGAEVLSNVVSSQIPVHTPWGGVVPEIASRQHLRLVDHVIAEALTTAGIAPEALDGVAVTNRPGLIGALVVGLCSAKAYAWVWRKPIVGVHHIEAHLHAARLDADAPPPLPFVGLVASGGHSDIILVEDWLEMRLLAETRDDAAGEALDKVARHLGLGYPGGPYVERVAGAATDPFELPVASLGDSLDFSFSGVKTAAVRLVERLGPEDTERRLADVVAGFQSAVMEPLARNAILACERTGVGCLVVGGGVAANSLLRTRLEALCAERSITLRLTPRKHCTDNAAMVAAAAWESLRRGRADDMLLDCASTAPIPRIGSAQ